MKTFVAARTLPGVDAKGAFFTRGSGHNKFGGYTEIPDEYQEVIDRLLQKHKAAAKFVPAPVIERRKGARIGIVTIGGCDPAVREALDMLAEAGTSPPISCAFADSRSTIAWKSSLNEHEFNFIVEQNRDAQLRSLLTLETGVAKDKLRSVLVYGGFPLSAKRVH